MNEILEFRRFPWHELQRSLAEAFDACDPQLPPRSPQPTLRFHGVDGMSWLTRARQAAGLPPLQAGR